MLLLEAQEEKLLPCLSQLHRLPTSVGSCTLLLISLTPASAVTPPLAFIACLSLIRIFVITLAQDHLPISRFLTTSVKSLLPCKIPYSQVLWIRASLGEPYSVYHTRDNKQWGGKKTILIRLCSYRAYSTLQFGEVYIVSSPVIFS